MIDSVKDMLDDKLLLVLAILAFLTMMFGLITADGNILIKLSSGIAIYICMFLVIIIGAFNDHMKDTQFVKLQGFVKDESITVLRGKYGATQGCDVYQLVVGDVIILETGSRIPADCLVIDSTDLEIDESCYNNGNVKIVKKKWFT
jgi:magnesium-transporting ATPase (P-type)